MVIVFYMLYGKFHTHLTKKSTNKNELTDIQSKW